MPHRHTMDRRSYLRVVGAAKLATGLTGCLGEDGDGGDGVTSLTPTSTGTPTSEATWTQTAPPAEAACAPKAAPTTIPPPGPDGLYQGPLFDTHFHLDALRPEEETPAAFASAKALCQYLEGHGVFWAIGFYALPPAPRPTQAPPVAPYIPLIEGTRARVIPLLGPVDAGTGFHEGSGPLLDGRYTESTLRAYFEPNWVFQGVGEIFPVAGEPLKLSLQTPIMQTVLRAADAIDGIVMIHPFEALEQQAAEVLTQYKTEMETSVGQHPDVTFLFHGGTAAYELVAPLISAHPNVFFTWDAVRILEGSWGDPMRPESVSGGGSSADFAADVSRIGMNTIVDESLDRFLPMLERFPDRIMWGTDQRAPWNYEPEATEVIAEISRRLIGRLPAERREAYAYRNALHVFEPYL